MIDDLDQARSRSRGRHDGSHRLRRDALSQALHQTGLAKAGPFSFVMRARASLLGTAAGGGFPQWNCWCPTCRIARRDPAGAPCPAPSPPPRSAPTASAGSCSTPRPTFATSWVGSPARTRVADPARAGRGRGPDRRRARPHAWARAPARGPASSALRHRRGPRESCEDDSRLLPVTRAFAEVTVTELVPWIEPRSAPLS